MDRRTYLRVGGGLVAAGLAGCFRPAARERPEYDVGMSTRDFQPETLEVDPGDTVVWLNTSSHAHTVTAFEECIPEEADFFSSGDFESQNEAVDAWESGSGGALYQGDSYEHTFEHEGVYHYYCIPHVASNMYGTIVVGDVEMTECEEKTA